MSQVSTHSRTHRMRTISHLLVLLSISILMLSCAIPSPAPLVASPTPTRECCKPIPEPTPLVPVDDSKQVLHVGLGNVDTIDPGLLTVTSDYEISQLIFPGLIQLDSKLEPIPWAASGWKVSADSTLYIFTLRPHLMWSNGTPIDALDFAYAINRSLDPCTSSQSASFLFAIARAVAFHAEPCVDGAPSGSITTLISDSLVAQGQTLIIKLEHPAAYFLTALSYPTSYAIPRAVIAQYGAQWTDHLADNGGLGGDLFKLTEWDKEHNTLTLTRNDTFWGAKSKLREIDFTLKRMTADQAADALYTAYISGTGDISPLSKAQYASARLRNDFHETPSLALQSLTINWSVPPFDNITMRKAFAIAINKQSLATDIQSNTVNPTNHILPEGIPGYKPDLTGPDSSMNLSGNSQSARAFAVTYASGQCSGGQLSKCPQVTLTIGPNPVSAIMATALQEMWKTAFPGYPIKLQSLSTKEFTKQVGVGRFQIALISWVMDYPDPQDILSNVFLSNGPFNWGKVNVAAASSLISDADINLDTTQRLSDYSQAEQLLVNNVAWIPLFQVKNFYVARPTVASYSITALGFPSSDIWQRVYIGNL